MSYKFYSIGHRSLVNSLPIAFRQEAQKKVNQVAHDCSDNSFFGIINEQNESLFIAGADSPHSKIQTDDVGAPVPFQTTAVGKALMAWRNERQVQAIITRNPPINYSDRAILKPRAYMAHLATIRKHGFTLNNQENLNNAVCVGAPVFSQGSNFPVGGISIVSDLQKMRSGFFLKASEYIYGVGKMFSESLGASSYPDYTPMPFPE